MAPTEAQEHLKDQFVHAHGYWNPLWGPDPTRNPLLPIPAGVVRDRAQDPVEILCFVPPWPTS